MENNDDCWDLFAVVRGCRAATRSLPPPLPEPLLPSSFHELTAASPLELEKLWNPLFSISQQPKPTPLPCSYCPASAATAAEPPRFIKQTRPLSHTMPRSKRRKNQQKRDVRQVPADGLAADMWAWRKYGQKPIKGSPYPRGYYRCSSSKGCLARKQVERSRTDPGMFVITYTGEHNHRLPTHRNSLAGTTRQKFPVAEAAGERGNSSESSALTASAGGLSPNSPLAVSVEDELLLKKRGEGSADEEEEEEETEEEGMLLVEDMEVVGEDEVLFMSAEQPQTSAFETSDAVAAFFSGGGGGGGGGGILDDDLLRSWLEDNSSAMASIRCNV